MTDRIFFDPAVQREFDEVADFYDLGSPGISERFIDAVMYWTGGEVIAVSAIAHQSRRPGYWQNCS